MVIGVAGYVEGGFFETDGQGGDGYYGLRWSERL